jgi:2-haloacid dehalogenase
VLLAFDIYGTVIDPGAIAADLSRLFGDRSHLAAQLWRAKQLEFTFRRALMRRYKDFEVCTAQALEFVGARLGVALDERSKDGLLRAYLRLPAFPEVKHSLEALRADGYRTVALTNGTQRSVHGLLNQAGIAPYFDAVLSADTIGTFKPDPAVYELAREAAGASEPEICLISGNPFDVIGAKAAGLTAAWVRRGSAEVFDPWEYAPDITIGDLSELCVALARLASSRLE